MVSLMDFYHVEESLNAERLQEVQRQLEQPFTPSTNTKQFPPRRKTENEEFKVINEDSVEFIDVKEESVEFKYVCTFCDDSFKRKDRLDRHLFSHTKKKTFCCDVDECKKSYTNKSHLNRHQRSVHEAKPEIASIDCKHPNCCHQFTNRSNMNRHYQTHHENPFPHSCNQCEEKFRRKLQLKKHEILKHTGKYAYTCPRCSKGFLNAFTFSRHLTTHKQENSCPDCPATFTKWSQLVEHRRGVHKNVPRFVCDICGKSFSRKPNIKQHMNSHLTTGANTFRCHYVDCPKFYNVKRNLVSHIQSKHLGKRWTCDVCTRELSTSQKLKQHKAAHLDPERAKQLKKVKSTLSSLVGLELPTHLEHEILKGRGSELQIDSLPLPESTQETSGTEFSDF